MKNVCLLWIGLLLGPIMLLAQQKPIEMADVHRWNQVENQSISNNGQWVTYQTRSVSEGNATVYLWDARTQRTTTFARAENPKISHDNQWLTFTIKPALDTVRALKRKKVKADDLPKDTLGIYNLLDGKLEKIARVKGYTLPEYWSGWLVVHLEPAAKVKEKPAPKDTTAAALPDSIVKANEKLAEKRAKTKKESADNGSLLLVRNLVTGTTDTLIFVKDYTIAERAPTLIWQTSGVGDAWQWQHRKQEQQGVYARQLNQPNNKALWRGKAKFKQLSLDEMGAQAAFLLDSDTSKAVIRPWQLALAKIETKDSAQVIAQNGALWLPAQPDQATTKGQWLISENARPTFSKDGNKLYFGIAPPPVLPDTTLLPEEVAKVEVWASETPYLHTVLKERMKEDAKRSWPVVCHLDQKLKMVPLTDPEQPELRISFHRDRTANTALGIHDAPYMQRAQWLGESPRDVYKVDLTTGKKDLVLREHLGSQALSPNARHLLWWSSKDTAWWAVSLAKGTPVRLTNAKLSTFYNDEEDTPDLPNSFGYAGFVEGEQAVILYDRYDLWQIDLNNPVNAKRLTEGYKDQTVYRYIRLDPEQQHLEAKGRLLLHGFNRKSKQESYHWFQWADGKTAPWLTGPYNYTKSPKKAKTTDQLLFNRQNFETFPDLMVATFPQSGTANSTATRVSNVNPQQQEYAWPTIEMVEWRSPTGDTLAGLLIKPAGFDAKKQYPMIVNFYEQLSDGLYLHRPPGFGRSQINYVQYASRGYVVFLPDIKYRIGYPGESAYNAIVSGTNAMIDRGGIDPKRVALQGHSWGGYQIAYIVTKTDMFRCAEAGAAVVNMTSAYGGIRWESGVSRHFQYEKQQSRIGGTLWEKPLHFVENSPLFSLDKVNTPLLLMHNDKDGAVPWEQGIEYFTGLRRLGKPAWLLNYNDEPHWPVKLPNRIDFQKRMQQFFDHYLLGAPEPRWMQRGIPPMEKDAKE